MKRTIRLRKNELRRLISESVKRVILNESDVEKQIEEARKNKSAKRPNFHKGSLSHSPSQTNGDAKVQINSEIAIPKLQKLAETYFGVSDPHRFW